MNEQDKFGKTSFTFDDVSLIPGRSDVLPQEVDVSTRLAAGIELSIPLVSAAMDTVTESRMAIAIAREGGIGILHRNLSIENQALEVDKVKRTEWGMISDPVTLGPADTLAQALEIMERYHISGVAITENGRLVGLLTNRDIRWATDTSVRIADLMTKEGLITAPVGTTMEEAQSVLKRHKVEKLPVVDADGRLHGLFTVKDIQKRIEFPLATKDSHGRLRCGAAVGVGADSMERAEALVGVGVDVLVVDTAHGHTDGVIEMVKRIKAKWDIPVVAGNVVTLEGVDDLVAAGADAVKVGVGPASICTTRIVAGVGVPQLTAVWDCARRAAKRGVPIIADGGIRHSGDIGKAIGAGADSVMLGALFAGVDESPGELVFRQGERYKEYRGMGSLAAMKERGYSKDRYGQEFVGEVAKLVPEGVEGVIRYKGPLRNMVYQLVGGIRASMGYVGARNIAEMKDKTRFARITSASLRESHPHDITIIRDAPNYFAE